MSVVKRRLLTASASFFERERGIYAGLGNTNMNFLARLTSLENPTESPAPRRRHFAETSFEKIRDENDDDDVVVVVVVVVVVAVFVVEDAEEKREDEGEGEGRENAREMRTSFANISP